jgi:hypothetical protein
LDSLGLLPWNTQGLDIAVAKCALDKKHHRVTARNSE